MALDTTLSSPRQRPPLSTPPHHPPGALASKRNPFNPPEADADADWLPGEEPRPSEKGRSDGLTAFGGAMIFLVVAGGFAWMLYLAFR